MKRCPSCNLTFADTESFCPKDGTPLVSAATSYDPQATMMSPPQVYNNSGNLPPANPFPADASGYNQQQQNAPNPSWGAPSLPQYAAAPHKDGSNKKVLVGVIAGVLLLGVIGIVLYYTLSSGGPSAKMNPYKGSLEDLAPKEIGALYTLVDVDKLGDKDKVRFGNVKEAIGVAYRRDKQDGGDIKMFVGNYSSIEDAQDGLSKFKNMILSEGWVLVEEKEKKINGSKIGLRFVAYKKTSSSSKTIERYLPDGATMVFAQSGPPTPAKEPYVSCWTNGSVLFAAIGVDKNPLSFESNYDTAIDSVTK